jgi:hypothetical protein
MAKTRKLKRLFFIHNKNLGWKHLIKMFTNLIGKDGTVPSPTLTILENKYRSVKEKPEEGAGPSHPDSHLFAPGSSYFRQVLQIPK